MSDRATDHRATDGDPAAVQRRAPFSDNPHVGARGQRTRQRILDAALQAFGENGYHPCSIDRITELAGCSRVAFYQYFSTKEDLFRHLTGQVARQLGASTEALDTITPDDEGRSTLRAWVGRHSAIYDRYEPVFHAFQAAAESDEMVAGGSTRIVERTVAQIRSRLSAPTLPARRTDPVIALLVESLTRSNDVASILRPATGDAYSSERIDDALADIVHRTLFGLLPTVNVHAPAGPRPPALAFGPTMGALLQRDEPVAGLTAAGERTLEALLAAARDVFVQRGFDRTRVDDIVERAGVSHGAFYRYFTNKEEAAQAVAVRAMRGVSSAFVEIPDTSSFDPGPAGNELRSWLRRYNAAHAPEAAAIRVWIDASRQDPSLRDDSATVVDLGRRQLATFLRPRGFGDCETDAVVMVAMLSGFGRRERSAASIEAMASIIERGLLGRP